MGALDTTFGIGGRTDFTTDDFKTVSLQPDGFIVIAGAAFGSGPANLQRLDTAGVLDSTLGTSGEVEIPQLANEGGSCPDDADDCTDDVCSEGTCAHPALADGTACEDGEICTAGDQYESGACETGDGTLTCGANDYTCFRSRILSSFDSINFHELQTKKIANLCV